MIPPNLPEPSATTVGQVSEDVILAAIFPLLPGGSATLVGPGDDAAVVSAPDARFVVSADVLVEGRHFRREWSTGYDVGWRAAMQNLADVAAMGARPTSLVVSLVMPGELPVDFVTGLAQGLAAACAPVGAAVVGGDLSGGSEVVVAVTVHGDLEGRAPVLRSGARPGDVVAHVGHRGWSAAGLALAGLGLGTTGCPVHEQDPQTSAYLRPEPPLRAGVDAAAAGATAMLDVSDGLLRDAGRIARASGVRLDIEQAAFAHDSAALEASARAVVEKRQPVPGASDGISATDLVRRLVDEWVLTGGEDHGLLATFPSGTVLPAGFRVVGRVLPRDGSPTAGTAVVTVDGDVPPVRSSGWDHFGT